MLLNEEDFIEINDDIPAVETSIISDSEIEPDGPEQGEATGIANIIHDLLIDENEAIQNYNNAVANMENYPWLQKIMHNIAGEEFAHIGELQKALEQLSPNAANIQEGEAESKENLGITYDITDEALVEGTEKNASCNWVNKGKDGEHGEFKTKKEADAQRKAMFANGFTESIINCNDIILNEDGSLKYTNGDNSYYYAAISDLKDDLCKELDNAVKLSESVNSLRLIDKAISICPSAKSLTEEQKNDIANYVNMAIYNFK